MTLFDYTKFTIATGEILGVLTVDDAIAADQVDGVIEGIIVGAYEAEESYIEDLGGGSYAAHSRPASAAAYSGNAILDNDGADTGTITPIGAAAKVTVIGVDFTGREQTLTEFDPWGADDTLEFTSTVPADYIFRIVDFPDLDTDIRVPVRDL